MAAKRRITAFPFRGSRDYLHSATVFDYFLARDEQPVDIDLQFHRITAHQCWVETELLTPDHGKPVATYSSRDGIRLLYEADQPITQRVDYNEEAIVRHISLDDNSAAFQVPPLETATFAESVIAAYKALLQARAPQDDRKLLFARLRVQHVPSHGTCRVVHRRTLGDDFFEARLQHNEQTIGSLYFRAK